MPGTRHVCISDRESDILALLVMTRKMNHATDYLVRVQHVLLPDRQGGLLRK